LALDAVRKELGVAFSLDAQPVWFRIAKWVIFLAVSRRLHGTRWFRVWTLGGALAGLTLHFVYRWKTRGWTRPWGGWADIK
jgi:hypothetical protein